MAKLNYVEGDYKEALNIYARVGLDDLPLTAVPPYRLRMIAEAYATKGEPAPARPWGLPQLMLSGASRAPCSLQLPLCPRLGPRSGSSQQGCWSQPHCRRWIILSPETRCFLRASVLQLSLKEMKEKHLNKVS